MVVEFTASFSIQCSQVEGQTIHTPTYFVRIDDLLLNYARMVFVQGSSQIHEVYYVRHRGLGSNRGFENEL